MVTRAVEGAQKRVEAHHFEIRKTLLDYDNVMNQQREVIYTLRRELMVEEDLEPVLQEFMSDVLDDVYSPLASLPVDSQDEARAAALARLREVFNLDRVLEEGARLPEREETEVMAQGILDKLKAETGPTYADILRYFLLEELDRCWKEHLRNMRGSICRLHRFILHRFVLHRFIGRLRLIRLICSSHSAPAPQRVAHPRPHSPAFFRHAAGHQGQQGPAARRRQG